MNDQSDRILAAYRERFGQETFLVRSPGRVNLIGEHTDYNEGFVLPAAVDKAIWMAIGTAPDGRIHLVSLDMQEEFECGREQLVKSAQGWPNYLLGVVDQFRKSACDIPGFHCVFGGDIPIGAGMSSSAALETGLAFSLNEMFRLGWDKLELVKLAQRAETHFVGVNCGIMDQFINLFGRKQQVVRLDCRSLEYVYYPFTSEDYHIVLCDTRVRRQLATSEYNVRRSQCEAGVVQIKTRHPQVSSLRDISLEMLEEFRKEMDPVVFSRCHYVIRENGRVQDACQALTDNDFKMFGRLMIESHQGLRDEYKVSCPELDLLVDIAINLRGVLGARMMGAGFGGCTIQLVEKSYTGAFAESIQEAVNPRFSMPTRIYVSELRGGTAIV